MKEGLRERVIRAIIDDAVNEGTFSLCELAPGMADRILADLSEWQPIESAPVDELVLAWCPKHRLVLLERHEERHTETWAVSPSGRMDCPEPTHWMPLPEPPRRKG